MTLKHLPVLIVSATVIGLVSGCLSLKTEHEIKPIEINVNVNVKVDRELNSFFDDLDKKNESMDPTSTK